MNAVSVIVAALAAGALTVRDAAAVKEAYARLRDAARRRLAGRADGELVLARHESAPDTWRLPLAAELDAAGAGSDAGLVDAARILLELVDAAGTRAGRYQVTITGSPGVQAGDHNTQDNTFGSAAGYSVVAGRDVTISASGGSVAAGETVSEALWPEADPGRAAGQRNLALRKAREMLRTAAALPEPLGILNAAGRYRLDPALIGTDLEAFGAAWKKPATPAAVPGWPRDAARSPCTAASWPRAPATSGPSLGGRSRKRSRRPRTRPHWTITRSESTLPGTGTSPSRWPPASGSPSPRPARRARRPAAGPVTATGQRGGHRPAGKDPARTLAAVTA